nr:acyl-CoA dehydrogenase family protein [Acinetobacter junii]
MQFTEEQLLIRDMAKSFAQEQIKPNASDWDRDGTFPKAALAQMGQLGFMGMLVPEQWGWVRYGKFGLCIGTRRSCSSRWCDLDDYERA